MERIRTNSENSEAQDYFACQIETHSKCKVSHILLANNNRPIVTIGDGIDGLHKSLPIMLWFKKKFENAKGYT